METLNNPLLHLDVFSGMNVSSPILTDFSQKLSVHLNVKRS